MRIAILTFHRAYNCGAMLQAWALQTVLERMGHRVEFPICNHVGEPGRWRTGQFNRNKHGFKRLGSILGCMLADLLSIPCEDVLRSRYKKFRESYLVERDCSLAELDKYYDLIVVGSDQVWNMQLTHDSAAVFFAENIPECVRKIAYAASYGDEPLHAEAIKRVVSSLERFSHLSVREPLAQRQLSRLTPKQIDLNIDPTLLLPSSDYEVIGKRTRSSDKPYLFMYTLFATPFFINTAKELARRLGVECVIAPCYQYSRLGAPRGLTYSISPDRLVGFSRGASYILTNSFHGTVMGVLFNKPFLSLREHVDKYESRPAALLNMIGCADRLCTPQTSLKKMEALLKDSIPASVQDKLNVKRAESLAWLERAIG